MIHAYQNLITTTTTIVTITKAQRMLPKRWLKECKSQNQEMCCEMLSSGNDIDIAQIHSHELWLPRSALYKIKPDKNHIM